MVSAPIRIDFAEPVRLHASQGNDEGITTFDVAKRLEERYSVIRTFIALHKKSIERIIAKELALGIKHGKSNDSMDGAISGQIQEIWRGYIINEEHGIKTMASQKRGDPSFIDTSDYYLSLTPVIIH